MRKHKKPAISDDSSEFSDNDAVVSKKYKRCKVSHRVSDDSKPRSTVSVSNSSEEEFIDGYDDELMGDDEDRKRLALMTEIDREVEIYKRVEAREAMKNRFEIQKRLKNIKKKQKSSEKSLEKSSVSNKSKSSNSSSDLKDRVKERKKNFEVNKEKGDKKFAMSLLKAKREEKKEREEEKEREQKKDHENKLEKVHKKIIHLPSDQNRVTLKASDVYTDDSSSDSDLNKSVKERHNIKHSNTNIRNMAIEKKKIPCMLKLCDLNKIRLSRCQMEKILDLPVFKKSVVGCFVRINIGLKNEKPNYQVAKICDVCQIANVYQLGSTHTNKALKLGFGTYEKMFCLQYISNQEFTESEFIDWKYMCWENKIPLLTLGYIQEKAKDIQAALTYQLKDEDIEKIVREKERYKTNPQNYALKKALLLRERDHAQKLGKVEEMLKIEHQILELEQQASHLEKMRTKTISNISHINDRNRKLNIEETEKAILEELKASKGKKIEDPFTRRSTKPCMKLRAKPEITEIDNSEESNKKNIDGDSKRSLTIETISLDLFAAHDFDIDLNIQLLT